MNVLPREKQIEVIAALCEGLGIRTVARLTDVNPSTVGSFAFRVRLWLHGIGTTASWSAFVLSAWNWTICAAASLASLKFQRTASTLSARRSALRSGTTLRRPFDMRSRGVRFESSHVIQLNQALIPSSQTSRKASCGHCVGKSIAALSRLPALVAGDDWPG